MGIRDREIERIKKYAAGLGVKVYFKPHKKGCGGAEWDMDNRSIHIYLHSNMSKTKIILYLLHELGHHLDWIYNNKFNHPKDLETQQKLCNDGPMYGPRPDLTKEDTARILQSEKDGVYYMEYIYKELDLKLPLWRIKYAQALDLYDYEHLHKYGRFPTLKETKVEKKKLKKYYKQKYGTKQ